MSEEAAAAIEDDELRDDLEVDDGLDLEDEVEDDADDDDDEEAVVEDTAGESDETGDSEEAEESEEESEPDPLEGLPTVDQLLEDQLSRLGEQANQWQTRHDRLAGTTGNELERLRQENERLRRGAQADRGGDDYGGQATLPPEFDAVVDTVQRHEAALQEQRVGSAQQEAIRTLSDFNRKYPAAEGLQKEMASHLTNVQEIQAAVQSGNAAQAAFLTEQSLFRAFAKAVEIKRKESRERQDTQKGNMRQMKKAATPVTAGKRKKAIPGRPKSPSEMSEEELAKALKRAGRKGF